MRSLPTLAVALPWGRLGTSSPLSSTTIATLEPPRGDRHSERFRFRRHPARQIACHFANLLPDFHRLTCGPNDPQTTYNIGSTTFFFPIMSVRFYLCHMYLPDESPSTGGAMVLHLNQQAPRPPRRSLLQWVEQGLTRVDGPF